LATATYQAWVNGDKVARNKQRRIAMVLVTFIIGCAMGARLAVLTTLGVLWIATGLKLILLAWLFMPAAMENPDR
jgi:hypothetical protein